MDQTVGNKNSTEVTLPIWAHYLRNNISTWGLIYQSTPRTGSNSVRKSHQYALENWDLSRVHIQSCRQWLLTSPTRSKFLWSYMATLIYINKRPQMAVRGWTTSFYNADYMAVCKLLPQGHLEKLRWYKNPLILLSFLLPYLEMWCIGAWEIWMHAQHVPLFSLTLGGKCQTCLQVKMCL